jgi:hypothetical protein
VKDGKMAKCWTYYESVSESVEEVEKWLSVETFQMNL